MKRAGAALYALSSLAAAAAAADPGAAGAAVFQRWCVHCHSEAPSSPGTLRLGWNGKGAVPLAHRTDLRAAYVTQVVREGLNEMPSFRPTEIGAAELGALANYLSREP